VPIVDPRTVLEYQKSRLESFYFEHSIGSTVGMTNP
jgi:hypothetical protein